MSCNNGYIEEDISAKIVSFNELLRIGGNAKFDSVNTNGQLEARGDLTVTNFLDLRAKVLVSGIMTVEDYKVNTYKDFYAFYLSIKKKRRAFALLFCHFYTYYTEVNPAWNAFAVLNAANACASVVVIPLVIIIGSNILPDIELLPLYGPIKFNTEPCIAIFITVI